MPEAGSIMKQVSEVLKEWNTCPATKKEDVLSQFIEHVKEKLYSRCYGRRSDAEGDLKIATVSILLFFLMLV